MEVWEHYIEYCYDRLCNLNVDPLWKEQSDHFLLSSLVDDTIPEMENYSELFQVTLELITEEYMNLSLDVITEAPCIATIWQGVIPI